VQPDREPPRGDTDRRGQLPVRGLAVVAVCLAVAGVAVATGVVPVERLLSDGPAMGNPTGDATAVNETELRAELHESVNEVRTERGLAALSYSSRLQEAAQAHIEDMGSTDYFSHVSPSGVTPRDRYDRLGIDCGAGENIFASSETIGDEEAFSDLVVEHWMESPEHRKNMLREGWRREGFGIAKGTYEGREAWYFTQNFC
jgi:uncharacterized protein YkwD